MTKLRKRWRWRQIVLASIKEQSAKVVDELRQDLTLQLEKKEKELKKQKEESKTKIEGLKKDGKLLPDILDHRLPIMRIVYTGL